MKIQLDEVDDITDPGDNKLDARFHGRPTFVFVGLVPRMRADAELAVMDRHRAFRREFAHLRRQLRRERMVLRPARIVLAILKQRQVNRREPFVDTAETPVIAPVRRKVDSFRAFSFRAFHQKGRPERLVPRKASA